MTDTEKVAHELAIELLRLRGKTNYIKGTVTPEQYANSYKTFYKQILEELKKES